MNYLCPAVAMAMIGLCTTAQAQSQTRFNYQAQIRDASDAVVPNDSVDLLISVRLGSATGPDSYREEHLGLTTTSIGLVNVLVGTGIIEVGDLDTIAWGSHQYYLRVDADFGGGYADMGTAPIASVPIAEFARNGGKPWRYNANGIHYTEGNVGIGDSLPQSPLSVRPMLSVVGDENAPTDTRVELYSPDSASDNRITSYDELGDPMWWVNMGDRSDNDSYSIWSQGALSHVMRIQTNGRTQLRGDVSAKLQLFAYGNRDNAIESYDADNNRKWLINMYDEGSADHYFGIFSQDANEYLMYIRPDGRTQVKCLEILGGCDINERFNSAEVLEPGTVVVADPDRPGEVRTTNEPYDQRVVGAISGANGIKPGLTLTQEGTALDGTHPVALDGRVYVKVTGPIEVGDLLTTSNESGKAMAVRNRSKAFGAVIGKALESDGDGDGYVLMLVQPR